MRISGLDAVRKKMEKVRGSIGRKAAKRGVAQGIKVVLQAAKEEAPSDTGTLKKALGHKTKSYRGGAYQMTLVGARAGQAREITRTTTKRGKPKIKLTKTKAKGSRTREVRDASKYLHLAERGRKAVTAKGGRLVFRGPDGNTIAAKKVAAFAGHHFMAKAWKRSKQQAAQTALKVISQEIDAALA